MADTGAPWNIPYIEPTDLVRNYPVANELMADAIAAGLTAAGNPGIGSNVVSVLKTDSFSASIAAGASTTVTGLSLSFTPTSATSKVLVLCQITGGRSSTARQYAALRANATLIDVGDTDGSRQRAAGGYGVGAGEVSSAMYIMALHSPATTSAVTYDVVVSHSAAGTDTLFVNRGPSDTDNVQNARTASLIVAIEVAA